MKVSVRSAIVTVVLAFVAGIGGMWLGRLLVAAPSHDQSLHAMVHSELSLTPEQDRTLDALETDFAGRRQALESDTPQSNAELAAAIRSTEAAGPAAEAAVHHSPDAMGAL